MPELLDEHGAGAAEAHGIDLWGKQSCLRAGIRAGFRAGRWYGPKAGKNAGLQAGLLAPQVMPPSAPQLRSRPQTRLPWRARSARGGATRFASAPALGG